jgi:hypothetical protein
MTSVGKVMVNSDKLSGLLKPNRFLEQLSDYQFMT